MHSSHHFVSETRILLSCLLPLAVVTMLMLQMGLTGVVGGKLTDCQFPIFALPIQLLSDLGSEIAFLFAA